MELVELLRLNLAVEPDLSNFNRFTMESAKQLDASAFSVALASLELNRRLREAGACGGQAFPVSLLLRGRRLLVAWSDCEFPLAATGETAPAQIAQLRDYLNKSTAAIDPEIQIQRHEAMVKQLRESRERLEGELADLQVKLVSRQAELQVSIHQAETDPLTELLNRRAFDMRLDAAFRHTMRQRNSHLSLLLLDLDHFKNINDHHGHLYGDSYLVKMSWVLRGVIREDVDSVFRFGGDEFAILIYADHHTACEKARQVLTQMEGKVSIGISTLHPDIPEEFTLEQFIRQADSALYEAKNRGRGRAVVGPCNGDTTDCTMVCVSREDSV